MSILISIMTTLDDITEIIAYLVDNEVGTQRSCIYQSCITWKPDMYNPSGSETHIYRQCMMYIPGYHRYTSRVTCIYIFVLDVISAIHSLLHSINHAVLIYRPYMAWNIHDDGQECVFHNYKLVFNVDNVVDQSR